MNSGISILFKFWISNHKIDKKITKKITVIYLYSRVHINLNSTVQKATLCRIL